MRAAAAFQIGRLDLLASWKQPKREWTTSAVLHSNLCSGFGANLNVPRSCYPMARVCDVCGRGPQFGHKVSHAHNVSNRRWNVNLQKVRAIVSGASKRIRACTSCIRNGKVQKAA